MKKVKYRQNVTWNYGDGSTASGRGDYYLKMPHVSTIYGKSLEKILEINKLKQLKIDKKMFFGMKDGTVKLMEDNNIDEMIDDL